MTRVPASGAARDRANHLRRDGPGAERPVGTVLPRPSDEAPKSATGRDWGPSTFGDPCRGCGHDRSLATSDAIALVAAIPAHMAAVLADCGGDERHPDLAWSTNDYVGHVVDNLRIWSERLDVAVAAARAATPSAAGCEAPPPSNQPPQPAAAPQAPSASLPIGQAQIPEREHAPIFSIVTYDADQLAARRRTGRPLLADALRELHLVVPRWSTAVERALPRQMLLDHPDRGALTVDDLVSTNAHDAAHHLWDLGRIVAAAR